MKLLTLNTHSLIEPAYEAKRDAFVEFIRKEQPDVFALQEVNQTAAAPLLADVPAASEAIYEALEQLADPSEYSEVLTDDPEIFHKLSESSHPLLQQKNLRLYDDPAISLRLLYSLEKGMDEALDTRVWLKCGGYLVIEPTEAMTVIDVNSGKNESKKMGEETYYQVNAEAAEEAHNTRSSTEYNPCKK